MARSAATSILFESPADRARADRAEAPACFGDLNLDQIVQAVTADWAEYNLAPFFNVALTRLPAITYRQEVMRDLENESLLNTVKAFADDMRAVRGHLAQVAKLYYKHQKDAWHLDAIDIYCRAVVDFASNLRTNAPRSRGLLEFLEHLGRYVASGPFMSVVDEAKALRAHLARIRYRVHIRGSSLTVSPYESDSDYSEQIEETFERFARGAVKDYRIKYSSTPQMNHIEAKILEYVAELSPEVFAALDAFCKRNADFMDATIVAFDREIHFYVAYLQHIEKFTRAGLSFCYPELSTTEKSANVVAGFDLALAAKLGGQKIVSNDFRLQGEERIIVVTGPNQGGKTTFARMFGQLHYLASLGCPIPGKHAALPLCVGLFTHFEREERTENLRGKLQDDLMRIRAILDQATPASILILNEIFTSTTLQDATFLSRKIMDEILGLDLLCVWVTFIDELAALGDEIVSMASTVDPQNPASRTFKILRKPADGLSYALSIAEKYHLTYQRLKERIQQ